MRFERILPDKITIFRKPIEEAAKRTTRPQDSRDGLARDRPSLRDGRRRVAAAETNRRLRLTARDSGCLDAIEEAQGVRVLWAAIFSYAVPRKALQLGDVFRYCGGSSPRCGTGRGRRGLDEQHVVGTLFAASRSASVEPGRSSWREGDDAVQSDHETEIEIGLGLFHPPVKE
jgi:hypothetical protein